MKQAPSMEVNLPKVNHLFYALQSKAITCMLNGLWLKTNALHEWVFSSWTFKYDIYSWSKGFFIIQFDAQEYLEKVMHEGP